MTTTGEYYAYEESIESTEAESRVISDQDYFDGFNDYEDHDPILRGLIEEIDEKGHEMLRTLFDKVETKDHHHHRRRHHHGDLIARAFRETLHEFKEKPVLEALEKFAGKINYSGEEEEEEKDEMTIMDRDFGGDEEFRMERFKVKTVIGAGVVKEERI